MLHTLAAVTRILLEGKLAASSTTSRMARFCQSQTPGELRAPARPTKPEAAQAQAFASTAAMVEHWLSLDLMQAWLHTQWRLNHFYNNLLQTDPLTPVRC